MSARGTRGYADHLLRPTNIELGTIQRQDDPLIRARVAQHYPGKLSMRPEGR